MLAHFLESVTPSMDHKAAAVAASAEVVVGCYDSGFIVLLVGYQGVWKLMRATQVYILYKIDIHFIRGKQQITLDEGELRLCCCTQVFSVRHT